jgi:hypothetical protein
MKTFCVYGYGPQDFEFFANAGSAGYMYAKPVGKILPATERQLTTYEDERVVYVAMSLCHTKVPSTHPYSLRDLPERAVDGLAKVFQDQRDRRFLQDLWLSENNFNQLKIHADRCAEAYSTHGDRFGDLCQILYREILILDVHNQLHEEAF